MIEAENLHKHFGKTHAVKGVSFRVERGEIIGLLGPNGSGKTTIMRILTGFFPPTTGSARIGGFDVENDSLEVRKRVGYLPENVLLYPDMPVERFLSFCAEVKGVPRGRVRQRVDAVIDDVQLHEVRRKEIGKCSKGFRQRVGIAQALISEPEVLILDEPTVGLDPNQVVEIRDLIRELRGKATILLSTHILPEVSVTCDRVIIMDRGRTIAEDTAEGLHRKVQGVVQTLVRVAGPREEEARERADDAHRGPELAPGRRAEFLKDVLQTIRQVPDVLAVDEQPMPSDPHVRVRVTSKGEEIRQAVARAIVEKGWALVEVSPIALSLEDLFVQLVARDRDAEEAKGH